MQCFIISRYGIIYCLAMLALMGGMSLVLSGCLSYQYERQINGMEIKDPGDAYPLCETSIADVLSDMGAPDEVYALDNKDFLIYERSILKESGLTLGIPIVNTVAGGSAKISASRALRQYDILVLIFNPHGILENIIFEKGSDRPYLKTLFQN